MKIIVGLGNPGNQYAGTRHNTGFSVVVNLSDRFGIPINHNECKALTGHGVINGEKVILAEPQTFMNLSGESVEPLLHFYRCDSSDLIVIYDDIDLDPGHLRLRAHGSAGGHNGMKNIIKMIGSDTFDRIRVGVGKKPDGWDLADWVLARPENLTETRKNIERAADAAVMIVTDGIEKAMNMYNG